MRAGDVGRCLGGSGVTFCCLCRRSCLLVWDCCFVGLLLSTRHMQLMSSATKTCKRRAVACVVTQRTAQHGVPAVSTHAAASTRVRPTPHATLCCCCTPRQNHCSRQLPHARAQQQQKHTTSTAQHPLLPLLLQQPSLPAAAARPPTPLAPSHTSCPSGTSRATSLQVYPQPDSSSKGQQYKTAVQDSSTGQQCTAAVQGSSTGQQYKSSICYSLTQEAVDFEQTE